MEGVDGRGFSVLVMSFFLFFFGTPDWAVFINEFRVLFGYEWEAAFFFLLLFFSSRFVLVFNCHMARREVQTSGVFRTWNVDSIHPSIFKHTHP